MKKIYLTVIAFVATISFCFAQDVITLKTGEDVQAKIIEVGHNDIRYKKYDFQEGPTYILLKSEIFMIKYENGDKDIFNEEKKTENITSLDTSSGNPHFQGQTDASLHYEGYKGAGTGTLIGSLISPILGLIPAIATSSTMPSNENLNFPSLELMKNADYYNGYTNRAKKIKQGKVWKNWVIGLAVNVVAALLIFTSN
jgi:hypothetical protein